MNAQQHSHASNGKRSYKKTLPTRLHVCRWCPTCGSDMNFSPDSNIQVTPTVISGIVTTCDKCGYVWPLTITISASNEPFLLELAPEVAAENSQQNA